MSAASNRCLCPPHDTVSQRPLSRYRPPASWITSSSDDWPRHPPVGPDAFRARAIFESALDWPRVTAPPDHDACGGDDGWFRSRYAPADAAHVLSTGLSAPSNQPGDVWPTSIIEFVGAGGWATSSRALRSTAKWRSRCCALVPTADGRRIGGLVPTRGTDPRQCEPSPSRDLRPERSGPQALVLSSSRADARHRTTRPVPGRSHRDRPPNRRDLEARTTGLCIDPPGDEDAPDGT
jgi:hypothetical protein